MISLPRFEKQRGAVMIEAAYVLPLFLVVSLLSVEAVSYATDRYTANNVLADLNESILIEAQAVSAGDIQNSQLVSCTANKVIPNESTVSSLLKSNISASSVGKGSLPEGFNLDYTNSNVAGLLVYVVNISFSSQTIVIPVELAKKFPVKANTIVTLGFSC